MSLSWTTRRKESVEEAIMSNPEFALRVNLNSDRKETGVLVWVPNQGKLPN